MHSPDLLLPRPSSLSGFKHLILELLHDLQSAMRSPVSISKYCVHFPVLLAHSTPVPGRFVFASVEPNFDFSERIVNSVAEAHKPDAHKEKDRVGLVSVSESAKKELLRGVTSQRGSAQIELLVSGPVARILEVASMRRGIRKLL